MKQIYLFSYAVLFVLTFSTTMQAQEFKNNYLRVPIVKTKKASSSTIVNESLSSVCTSNLGGAIEPSFVKFKIKETSFDHITYAAPSIYYHEYPITNTTSTELTAGQEYVFYTFTSSEAVIAIWIDYNQNDQFEEEEWVELVNNMQSENTTTFTVSANALVGKTKMRIRSRAYGSAIKSNDACASFGSGETRDYTISIKTASLSVGDIEKENNPLSIYPNPTSGWIWIQDEKQIENISLYNETGKLLSSTQEHRMNLSEHATGLYIVRIEYKDGQSAYRKVVKK